MAESEADGQAELTYSAEALPKGELLYASQSDPMQRLPNRAPRVTSTGVYGLVIGVL